MSPATPPARPSSPTRAVALRPYSIRAGLLALVAASVLPALGALGLLLYEDHLQRERELQRETLLSARGLMATLDRDLAKVESGLQVLAASNRLAASDLTSFGERLKATPLSPFVTSYLLVDPDGRSMLDSRGRAPSPSRVRASLARVFETGEPIVSNAYDDGFDDAADGRPFLAMGVPVRRAGAVVYVLAAELSAAQVSRLLATEPLPPGWVAGVLDGAGAIVARSVAGAHDTGGKVGPELQARIAAAPEGTFEVADADGLAVITSYVHSPLSGMTTVVGAPRSPLSTRLSSSLAWLLVGGTAVLGLALGFALWLARSIGRSVEGLIEPALALGSGRVAERFPTRIKEVDAVGRAIEQASRMLAEVRHQAHHDALTGLCNRVLFDEVAMHQITVARRAGQRLALLAIDLDGFKAVNDVHGHAAGDDVLRTAADRIRRSIRASDVVSRRGGDEFTVLLRDVGQVLTRQIGQKLVSALAAPYRGVDVPVSASIGIALFPESGATVDELLAHADEALYEAKKGGKRRLSGDV